MRAMDFLDQIYATAGANAFEGIGSHPYPRTAPYVATMQNRLDALRSVRDKYGDNGTPLWITEVGITTDPSTGVDPDVQGDVLAELYRSIEGSDVAAFIIHRLHDFGGDQYGVLNQDLTPKPAYCDLGNLIGTVPSSCPQTPTATPPPPPPPPPASQPPPGAVAPLGTLAKKCKKKKQSRSAVAAKKCKRKR